MSHQDEVGAAELSVRALGIFVEACGDDAPVERRHDRLTRCQRQMDATVPEVVGADRKVSAVGLLLDGAMQLVESSRGSTRSSWQIEALARTPRPELRQHIERILAHLGVLALCGALDRRPGIRRTRHLEVQMRGSFAHHLLVIGPREERSPGLGDDGLLRHTLVRLDQHLLAMRIEVVAAVVAANDHDLTVS